MKILVINGSPKGDKSDTMHMTRAFLEGMDSVTENETTKINIIEKNIGFCRGCLACMRNGGTCIQNDDMKQMLELIRENEIVIFSFPLYGYGMPGNLKTFIDRILPLSSIGMRKEGERYVHDTQVSMKTNAFVMICGSGFPNFKGNFEPVEMQFRMMFRRNATTISVPEAPMFNVPIADSVTKPFLKLITAAGREYAETGAISESTMARIRVPMIPQEQYAQIVNGGK